MNRDQYLQRLKTELERWYAQLDLWEANAQLAQAKLHAQYETQLGALHQLRRRAEQRLREVQSTPSAAWPDIERGAEHAWRDLRDAFDDARVKLESIDDRRIDPGPKNPALET